MSATITMDEAQAKLKELIHNLAPGEEVIIAESRHDVAKLVNQPPKTQHRDCHRRPGLGTHYYHLGRRRTPERLRGLHAPPILPTHTARLVGLPFPPAAETRSTGCSCPKHSWNKSQL